MNIIVCIDDDGGMIFNHRRQSKDRMLRQRMLFITAGAQLWMNQYSASQFEEESLKDILVDQDPLSRAAEGDWCFIEDLDTQPYAGQIEKIALYKWNRRYPSDRKFAMDLSSFELTETSEFAGSSHDKITEEIYVRNPIC